VLARSLYQNYSTTRAVHRALNTTPGQTNDWSDFVPLGSPWSPPPINHTSVGNTTKSRRKQSTQTKRANASTANTTKSISPPFEGDRTLAKSITVMRDLIWQRELAYAVAEGDVGRVYEILKVWTLCEYTHLQCRLLTCGRCYYSCLLDRRTPNTPPTF
jgi:hypothetical protein